MKQVNKFMKRKTMIYKTEVEYGDYTINHVLGCAHGCKYPCYAFMMAKRFGKVASYEEWIEPCLVENALELIEKEIPKFKSKINILHLCFTTDPFMFDYPGICDMSISILKMLNENDIKCSVLTKGKLPRELELLSKDNEYGITLVSIDENYRGSYEPNSANYDERINSLKYLHEQGFKTWVSIEPYPTPNIINQDLRAILEAVSFVDKIIFGRTNYSKIVTQYKEHKAFYNVMSNAVIKFCVDRQIDYHIKEGTLTNENN